MLTVVKRSTGDVRSERAKGPCTGEMWRDILQQKDGTSVSKNFFTPCARTHWHSHEGGQMLIVESGEGFVATEDEVVRMGVGDIVWTPPGVRHWHGGSHERSMLHLAISFGAVDWQEAVPEELYESMRPSS
ncbi:MULTISPECIES: cupin domain-containing protein [Amycolatopsis]|uniref:cupin domain-containing protein n=1 Tax=Amycolatopsis TaxID=1813 RepID=UPI0007DEE6BE|nr:cupin domain-containing protein [Amycolatopsis sp. M39]OAP23373.1 Cupin domain protein [Amycolatopsis sp. M39]